MRPFIGALWTSRPAHSRWIGGDLAGLHTLAAAARDACEGTADAWAETEPALRPRRLGRPNDQGPGRPPPHLATGFVSGSNPRSPAPSQFDGVVGTRREDRSCDRAMPTSIGVALGGGGKTDDRAALDGATLNEALLAVCVRRRADYIRGCHRGALAESGCLVCGGAFHHEKI